MVPPAEPSRGSGLPPPSRRLESLTGLRFAAALAVVVGHMHPTLWSVTLTMVAVSFFFVLSGFVLTWSAQPEEAPGVFWRRRFFRIVPSHAVVWLAMLVLLAATAMSPAPGFTPAGVPAPGPALANLLLVHTWVLDPAFLYGVNPPSWSLSVELFFYFLFPLVIPLVRRIPARWLPLPIAATIAVIWALPAAATAITGPPVAPGWIDVPLEAFWLAYFSPASRLPEFLLGILLARAMHHGFAPRVGVVLPSLVLFACVAAAPLVPRPFTFAALSVVPAALIVLGTASLDLRRAPSLWRTPAMLHLGRISFALYLTHYPVLLLFEHYCSHLFHGVPGAAGAFVLQVAASMALAWLLFRFVEQPTARRFGASRPKRPRTGADGSTPAP
ncbi:acyltransferase family protein [Nocardiopsis ganjiahuensis]|uniref:acyltransferase family protein n=1 Tax=Nocardiopsis ganjiahuensis TaxID=239984 RepID=UPI00037CC942|nr:acyltransferase [Nocardiopsis ganjiahuensis]